MNIQEVHYDINKKLNKVDSQQYRNLLIPEKDWTINEAIELFVKNIAKPRVHNHLGFEKNQRTIDDIRTLVVEELELEVINNEVVLPDNYWHYVDAYALCSKENCENVRIDLDIQQHDDKFKDSSFEESSFSWRQLNAVFHGNNIKTIPKDFTVERIFLTYIRRPLYAHYAQGFKNNTYTDLKGNVLTGTQDIELPEHTHREIVDIAVLLVTGELQIPDYQIKMAKVSQNRTN